MNAADRLEQRTLCLTLKRRWFDMIASGVKREEYREMKPYWHSRFGKRSYDLVQFRNGYRKDAPVIVLELKEILSGLGIIEWGAPPKQPVYILRLGAIINRVNHTGDAEDKAWRKCTRSLGKPATNCRLYRIWRGMIARCNDPKSNSYRYYGAKGISVCDEWMDYAAFRKWAIAHGYGKVMTIDRLDSSLNYCPSNCQWLEASANYSKGKQGEGQHNSRLTAQDVLAIRAMEKPHKDIASQFGININHVSKIKRRERWAHI